LNGRGPGHINPYPGKQGAGGYGDIGHGGGGLEPLFAIPSFFLMRGIDNMDRYV